MNTETEKRYRVFSRLYTRGANGRQSPRQLIITSVDVVQAFAHARAFPDVGFSVLDKGFAARVNASALALQEYRKGVVVRALDFVKMNRIATASV